MKDLLAQLNASSHRSELEGRIPALDGIRGVAILMVLVWHLYTLVPRPAWTQELALLEYLAQYGWAGVHLFFVLSGFLIGRILASHRGDAGYYRVFFVRRACRILPLYLLSLTLYLLFRNIIPWEEDPLSRKLFDAAPPLWSYPFFLQNFSMAEAGSFGGAWLGVTWSLAIEEQFYLFLPFVVALLPPPALPRVMLGLIILSACFRWAALEYQLVDRIALVVLLPARIDAFAFGVIAGVWRPTALSMTRVRWLLLLSATIGTVGAVYQWSIRGNPLPRVATYHTFIGLGMFSLFLWIKCSQAGHISRCLSWRPLAWLGSVSYFVYLFHQVFSHAFHMLVIHQVPNLASPAALAVSLIALGTLLACAEFSRRYLETPLIRLGKRYEYSTTRTISYSPDRGAIDAVG